MSAQSGIAINDEVVEVYTQLQRAKSGKEYGYAIFKMNDIDKPTEVVLDCTGEKGAPFEEFVSKLPADACRYAVVDIHFETGADGKRDKICFIHWNPQEAKIKQKMHYASTKDTLKKKLNGLHAEYQADGYGEMNYDDILGKVKKTK